ncbi:MAG: hypothetical protein ACRDAG_01070 [Cetobacterium somerae]|uniref:hypothetical protein n=1 Tax=Cetobacterium somerae TaxID=188913 RepID=UPI003F3FEC4B
MALLLDLEKRDLLFNKNKNFQICDKQTDITQRILLKLELNKREWFLNDTGVPWHDNYDGIVDKSGEEAINLARIEVTKVLTEDKSVISIKSMSVVISGERIVVNFTVYCTDKNEYTITISKGGATNDIWSYR